MRYACAPLFVTLVGCSGTVNDDLVVDAGETCAPQSGDDIYAIWRAVLAAAYPIEDGDDELLVRETTLSGTEVDGYAHDTAIHMETDAAAADDMVGRGAFALVVDGERLGDDRTFIFVARCDIPDAERDDIAWVALFQHWPNAPRFVVELAQPGFACDHALVYWEKECGDYCKSGNGARVDFVDGEWVVTTFDRTWIS